MRILKQPLVIRVVEQLEDCIQQGEWSQWLPSEKHLAKSFGVSRTTLRQALQILREKGVIETQQGMNTRIVKSVSEKPAMNFDSQAIGMLSPEAMGQLRQHTLLWLDELRSLFHEADLSLQFHSGLTAFRGSPEHEIDKLVKQYRSSVWILFWTQKATQKAFAKMGIPTVVVGAVDASVDLNTASVDNQSIAYHAVGQFTAKGHTSLALVNTQHSTTGTKLIETSFSDTISQKSRQGIRGQVIYASERDPEKLKRALLSTRKQKDPPTGFLFIHPLHMLTAYNAFQGAAVSIPGDVSLLSAFADQAFDFLSPKPSFYRMNPQAFAEKLFKLVNKLREGVATPRDSFQIIPELVPGNSIGRKRKVKPV